MAIAHTLNLNFSRAGESLASAKSIDVDAERTISASVPVGNNQLFAFQLDVSQLKTLYMKAVGGDLLLETNNASTPDDTFTLKDGEALAWHHEMDVPNPFASAVDVTALYVTNAEAAAVTLEVRVGYDPTV